MMYNKVEEDLEGQLLAAADDGDLKTAIDLLEEYKIVKQGLVNTRLLHFYLRSIIDWNCYSKETHKVNLAFVDLVIEKGGDLNKIEQGQTILDIALNTPNKVMDTLIKHLFKHYQPVAVKHAWMVNSKRFKKKYIHQ